MYREQAERLERIHDIARRKIKSGRYGHMDDDALLAILVDEALSEEYDDPIKANLEADFVRQAVFHALKSETLPERKGAPD